MFLVMIKHLSSALNIIFVIVIKTRAIATARRSFVYVHKWMLSQCHDLLTTKGIEFTAWYRFKHRKYMQGVLKNLKPLTAEKSYPVHENVIHSFRTE